MVAEFQFVFPSGSVVVVCNAHARTRAMQTNDGRCFAYPGHLEPPECDDCKTERIAEGSRRDKT